MRITTHNIVIILSQPQNKLLFIYLLSRTSSTPLNQHRISVSTYTISTTGASYLSFVPILGIYRMSITTYTIISMVLMTCDKVITLNPQEHRTLSAIIYLLINIYLYTKTYTHIYTYLYRYYLSISLSLYTCKQHTYIYTYNINIYIYTYIYIYIFPKQRLRLGVLTCFVTN